MNTVKNRFRGGLRAGLVGVCLAASALIPAAAEAQSGLQYELLQDNYEHIIGAPTSDGMDVELDEVDLVTLGLAGPEPVGTLVVAWYCDGRIVAAPESCANGQAIGFAATDIATGADGTVYLIGNRGPGGADKYVYRLTATRLTQMPAAAVRVAVGPGGHPWVVNAGGEIFRWTGNNWLRLSGWASDIGSNGNGVIWVIGSGGLPYRWNDAASDWVSGSGAGVSISVDPQGNPWVVNAQQQIWRHTGSDWQLLPGAGTDLAIAGDGTAFVIGSGGQVWRLPKGASNWAAVSGAIGERIAAGPAGFVYSKATAP
jgi:hypothetical protein